MDVFNIITIINRHSRERIRGEIILCELKNFGATYVKYRMTPDF